MIRLRRAAAFVSLVLGVGLWPGPAVSEPPDAAGWWWKAQAVGLVPVPAPPTIPSGGLYVAGDPSGPFAVSAVRLFIPADMVVGPMVLRTASVQGTVSIRACPTSIQWGPEQGGQMASAPAADCSSGAVVGQHDSAAQTVTFEAAPLVRDGYLNVLLMPTDGAVFSASFQPPGPDTVTLTPRPSDDPPAPSETEYLQGPAFTDTVVSDVAPPVYDPPPSSAGPAVSTTTTSAPPRRVRIIPVEDLKNASKSGRDRKSLIASFVFTGLGAGYILLMQRNAAAAAATGPPERGVGRFRRARTGHAPKL